MALVWLALAVAVLATAASLIYLTLQALDAFRAFKRVGRTAGEELERIEKASAEIERHLELAAAGGTRLEASLARLQESRARLTVLTSALADTRAALNRVIGVYPRK
jgi:outer membrane protein TolC